MLKKKDFLCIPKGALSTEFTGPKQHVLFTMFIKHYLHGGENAH